MASDRRSFVLGEMRGRGLLQKKPVDVVIIVSGAFCLCSSLLASPPDAIRRHLTSSVVVLRRLLNDKSSPHKTHETLLHLRHTILHHQRIQYRLWQTSSLRKRIRQNLSSNSNDFRGRNFIYCSLYFPDFPIHRKLLGGSHILKAPITVNFAIFTVQMQFCCILMLYRYMLIYSYIYAQKYNI